MDVKIANKKILILYMIVFTISILTTLLIAFDENVTNGYQLLWLLPLSFAITTMLTINITRIMLHSIILAVIWWGYFIRFVLTPLFLRFGDYRIIFSAVPADSIERAVLLMVYEIIIVFSCLAIYLKLINRQIVKAEKSISISLNNKGYKIVNFVLFLLVLLCISNYLYIPEIKDNYTSIFTDKSVIATIDYQFDSIATRGTTKRVLYTLFIFVFNIIRYIIPVYLLKLVHIKCRNFNWSYTVSLLICMLPFLVISESNIEPFFGLILNVVMMTKLYPEKTKSIIRIFAVLGTILISSILLAKLYLLEAWQGTSGGGSLSLTINAYFPGVGNAAAAYNIVDNNKWQTFFYDMFSTIPFRNTLFPSISSKAITVTNLFNLYNGTTGNIIPCISCSEYYFGAILSPIVPAFFSCFAIKMKVKAEALNDFWYYFCFLFLSVRVAMIPTLYNHVGFVNIFISLFIPIYFIAVFVNRTKVSSNVKLSNSEKNKRSKLVKNNTD